MQWVQNRIFGFCHEWYTIEYTIDYRQEVVMMTSNFSFLRERFPVLAREARAAACVTAAQAELRRLRAAILSRAFRGEL